MKYFQKLFRVCVHRNCSHFCAPLDSRHFFRTPFSHYTKCFGLFRPLPVCLPGKRGCLYVHRFCPLLTSRGPVSVRISWVLCNCEAPSSGGARFWSFPISFRVRLTLGRREISGPVFVIIPS